MSLRDELDAPLVNGKDCSVKTFVESKDTPEEWIEIIDDKGLQHAQVYRLMRKHGFALTANPVTRHRNGLCSCDRASG